MLLDGILNGMLYALVAVGLCLIWGVMDVINFAHGEYVLIAMYDGTAVGLWKADSLGSEPEGITLDGDDLWVADRSRKIFWYADGALTTTGTFKATKTFAPAMSGNLKGIVTDGSDLWAVTEGGTDYVYRFTINREGSGNPTGLSLDGSWKLDAANSKPTGITLDPTGASQSLWVVDESSDSVYEYANGRSLISGTGTPTTSFKLGATDLAPQGIADPLAWSHDASAQLGYLGATGQYFI